MGDDTKQAALFVFGAVFLLTCIFGSILYGVYTNHVEELACIQSGKSVIRSSCVRLAGDQP